MRNAGPLVQLLVPAVALLGAAGCSDGKPEQKTGSPQTESQRSTVDGVLSAYFAACEAGDVDAIAKTVTKGNADRLREAIGKGEAQQMLQEMAQTASRIKEAERFDTRTKTDTVLMQFKTVKGGAAIIHQVHFLKEDGAWKVEGTGLIIKQDGESLGRGLIEVTAEEK